jgi:2-polyprenyl-3-methyl-5-hydroxy-6-metoxy-1,4-benzoquinol methylase
MIPYVGSGVNPVHRRESSSMTAEDQQIREAWLEVARAFPFAGYMDHTRYSAENVARTVLRHLAPGSSILDFGAGPCDKTAVLSRLGFRCAAVDDFGDDWHRQDGNLERIRTFARDCGIDLQVAEGTRLDVFDARFDMVMAHDVLEHLHESPRNLLIDLAGLLKPRGLLFITVPNAGNIRKRLALATGGTNLPSFETYFWQRGPWRGHVREYVRGDLESLVQFLGFEVVEFKGCHHMLGSVSPLVRPVYLALSRIFSGWRDSWMLVASKPIGWQPKLREPGENERICW